MSFTPGEGQSRLQDIDEEGEEPLLTQREQTTLVDGSEKFHVLAVTRDGRNTHVNTVHAADKESAMNLTAEKFAREHSGEPKEVVYAFHEATEFKVVSDAKMSRFKRSREYSPDDYEPVG